MCQDQYGTTVFTDTTDGSGNLLTPASNIITHSKYVAGAALATPVVTTYSPHKFTISKAGYQTLVLEAITVSSKINWHLELQGGEVMAKYVPVGIGVRV